jgi:hypothetical protein
MLSCVKRCAIQTEDWLRNSPVVRGVLSKVKLWSERLGSHRSDHALVRAINKLCAAARLATGDDAVARIQQRIRERITRLNPACVDWSAFVAHVDDPWVPRGVVLKPWVSEREKGVLFIAFEKEWFKLLRQCDLRAFAARYDLVVAPSSSPHNLINYVFAAAYPGPLFTLISNESDRRVLPRVSSNFVVLPLYASNWVNPALFQPLPRTQRDIDLIMVASFGKVKRHHALFTAIRRMPRDLRIVLIGQDQDNRTAETIFEEARHYGVAGRFTVQSNQSYESVAQALCRARASVILSRREGSCVVVAESLFADTPAALLERAEIGSRAFLNPETGRFLQERNLGRQLTQFVAESDRYQPRSWAEANITCFRSTQILNDELKQHAERNRQAWTVDLAPLCWRPDPCLVRCEDAQRLLESSEDIRQRFGLDVGPRAGPPERPTPARGSDKL